MPNYPKKDFPWTFYFNGVAMPKWGACWPVLPEDKYRQHWDWDIGPRDFYLIRQKIDRLGTIESANPHAFLYAVQEILCLLFTERSWVMDHCCRLAAENESPAEIFEGLIEAAFQMRDLARRDSQAMWVSGYDADRLRLVEAMRCAALPPDHPEHQAPPHIVTRQNHLRMVWQNQIKTLHQAASAKNVPNEMRKKLLEL